MSKLATLAIALLLCSCEGEIPPAPPLPHDPLGQEAGPETEDPREPRPDEPMAAEQWRLLSLRDEHGIIPHDALMRAKTQAQGLVARRGTGSAGGLDPTKWTELGPGNIGGRIRAIAIDPVTPTTMLLGSVAGGIWRTTDGGATWSRVDDLLENLAITAILYTPGTPAVLYAATGEGFGNGDAIRGAGIFKSVNGGLDWFRLPATNTPDFYWVNELAISPDASTLLAATGSGMWRSTDGGTTWSKVYGGPNAHCVDVDFHRTDSSIAVGDFTDYDFGLGTWYTTSIWSTDGGATWQESTGLRTNEYYDRVELAFHRGYSGAGNGCVYALKNASGTTILERSIDGGATFSQVSTSSILGSQGWYDNVLWIDPTDADANPGNDVVVAGGIDLWRSTDGGASFVAISDWTRWPSSAHADQHIAVEQPGFDGTTNRTVFFGNDGGIWRTDDVYAVTPGSGWVNLNHGLGITQFYGGSRTPTIGVVIGGTQDNGTLRYTDAGGANAWSTMFGGDGGFCASDPTESRYHYGEYVFLQIHRSTNGGVSASYIWSGIADAGSGSTANFIAPFVLDPNDPHSMLAGGRSLWRSTNVKSGLPLWSAIKPPTPAGDNISAIAVMAGNSNVVWVGHNNGDVWCTRNGTAASPTWQPCDNTSSPALPDRFVTRITIDPGDSNHVYVTFGGFAPDNIWETKDSGATWQALTGLPSAPVRDLEIHPVHGSWLYAATEVGLLVSEDGGATWTSAATPANVSIDELLWSSGSLYLITHGRGMFRQSPFPAAGTTMVGTPCRVGGALAGPSLTATAPQLGGTTTFTVGAAVPGATAAILISDLSGPPLQISPRCYVQVWLASTITLPFFRIGGAGNGKFDLRLPDLPGYAGVQAMTQAVVSSGGNIDLSNGVKLTFGY